MKNHKTSKIVNLINKKLSDAINKKETKKLKSKLLYCLAEDFRYSISSEVLELKQRLLNLKENDKEYLLIKKILIKSSLFIRLISIDLANCHNKYRKSIDILNYAMNLLFYGKIDLLISGDISEGNGKVFCLDCKLAEKIDDEYRILNKNIHNSLDMSHVPNVRGEISFFNQLSNALVLTGRKLVNKILICGCDSQKNKQECCGWNYI